MPLSSLPSDSSVRPFARLSAAPAPRRVSPRLLALLPVSLSALLSLDTHFSTLCHYLARALNALSGSWLSSLFQLAFCLWDPASLCLSLSLNLCVVS
jgi:hypothetical protein